MEDEDHPAAPRLLGASDGALEVSETSRCRDPVDGLDREGEKIGDLPVGLALRDELQNLTLSICQRIDTSTCIPICPLDSASIASICSPRVGHCSSRVE